MCFLHSASLGGHSVKYANTHPTCAHYDPIENIAFNPFLSKHNNSCRACKYCGMEYSGRAMEYSKEHPDWIPGVQPGKTIPVTKAPKKQEIPKDRFALIDMR
jgi:hypothetical protein